MSIDPWHYPRHEFAQQILNMFESGISNTLIFFAPRRMGKTEFLCKDIAPLAKKNKWKVFYYSFLNADIYADAKFTKALSNFANEEKALKTDGLLRRVSKIGGEAAGLRADIQLRDETPTIKTLEEIIQVLCKKQKLLLLMDEVQALTQNPANANFIASLRTILDINKEEIKVIFTGSSQIGLRRMFSQSNAPFFHFGINLPFPALDRGFTEHLAHMFETVTHRKLNRDALWLIFQETQHIPQLARALVECMALNPQLSINEAKTQLMSQIFDDRAFVEIWEKRSMLEKLLLIDLAKDISNLFSIDAKKRFCQKMGIEEISSSSIQAAFRNLLRKSLIGRVPEERNYFIEDPNFKNWLLSLHQY